MWAEVRAACAQLSTVFVCSRPPRSVSETPIRAAGISQRKSWQGDQGAGIQHLLLATPPLPLHPHRYVSHTTPLAFLPTARLHGRRCEAFRASDWPHVALHYGYGRQEVATVSHLGIFRFINSRIVPIIFNSLELQVFPQSSCV